MGVFSLILSIFREPCSPCLSMFFCLTLFLLKPSAAQTDYEVYCGRHFNALATRWSKDLVVARPTVLALYDNTCTAEVDTLFQHEHLPPSMILSVATCNVAVAEKYIWYNLDATDDLRNRYAYHQCPTLLYFPEGASLDNAQPITADQTVTQFVWEKFKVVLKLTNGEDYNVIIQFSGRGPQLSNVTLNPGEGKDIDVYMSYKLLAFRKIDDVFIFGHVMNSYDVTDVTVKVNDTADPLDRNAWEEGEDHRVTEMENIEHYMRKSAADSYLKNFKQPVLVPKLSPQFIGYEKRPMPKELYKLLRRFHQSERETNMKPEQGRQFPTTINSHEVMTGILHLSEDIHKQMTRHMQEIMEKWVRAQLRMTAIYGIREYYEGNILATHVDRVETHVVSAILLVQEDLKGQEPWPLEVIDFNGDRKNVTMQPGEMLLYESATLPHGRPYPFKGGMYANAYIHFMPTQNWRWRYTDQHAILTNGTINEKMDDFPSALLEPEVQQNMLYRWTPRPFQDEL